MISFIKKGGGGLALVGVSSIISFLIMMFLSRETSIDDFSRIQFIFSLVLFLSSLCRAGFDLILIKEWPKLSKSEKIDFSTAISIVTVLLATICGIFIIIYYDYGYKSVSFIWFTIIGISFSSFVASYYKTKGRSNIGLGFDTFFNRSLMLISLVLFFIFNPKLTVDNVVIVNFLSFLLPLLLFFTIKIKECREVKVFEALKKIKKYLVFSLSLSMIGLLQSFLKFIDVFFIEKYLTSQDLAYYSVAIRFSLIIFMLNTVVSALLVPKISQSFADKKSFEVNKYYTLSAISLCSLSIVSFVTFYFFGEYVIMAFGEEYLPAYNIALILLMANVVNLSLGLSGVCLSLVGGHKDFLKIMILTSMMALVLYPIVSRLYFLDGVVILSAFLMIFWKLVAFSVLWNRYDIKFVRW
ncbi:oligosaccharide flippase family protein [Vibrio sp. 10N.239.312.D08]|uniref:oligosaccharide flippase family protein n=1 Tax=Vibrio sp. 10N.239.312.D08 TaxID=3229978 RepID=UPI0035517CBF